MNEEIPADRPTAGGGPVAGMYGRFRALAPAEHPWGEYNTFDAIDTESGERAVVVVLPPELQQQTGFEAVFHELVRLDSAAGEGTLAVLDHGLRRDGAWVAVAGPTPATVSQLTEEEGAVAPDRARSLVIQAARAMASDHAAGRRTGSGGPQLLMVADVDGRERALLAPRSLSSALLPSPPPGTAGHARIPVSLDSISPEEVKSEQPGPYTDVYALGCTLHVLLTGRAPYERDTEPAVLWAHLSEPPPSVREASPQLPEWTDEVLARAMAKEPAERFADGPALAEALEADGETGVLEVAGEVPPLEWPAAFAQARPRRITSEVLSSPSRLVLRSTIAVEDLAPAFPALRLRPGFTFLKGKLEDHEILFVDGADVMDSVEGDGSPLSFLQASLLARESELRGDPQWYLHGLVLSPPGPPSGGVPDWKWLADQPSRWEPAVERRADGSVVVTFHTVVTTFEDRLFRHQDVFAGPGYRFTPNDELIASHPHGPRTPW